VAFAHVFDRFHTSLAHGQHIHAVHLLAGDAEAIAAAEQLGGGVAALHGGSHRVFVVFDDVDHRQLPQGCHVERFIDLPLIHGTVAEIGRGEVAVLAVFVGEGNAGADGNLRANDAVAAVEMLFGGEHVHRAALALGEAADTPGEFGHDTLGVHAAGHHVAMVT